MEQRGNLQVVAQINPNDDVGELRDILPSEYVAQLIRDLELLETIKVATKVAGML